MQWMALYNLWLFSIIPAILFLYLLKRKYEEKTVPSVLLWQQVLQNREVNRPFQRLQKNLLLLLQLLAALLLLLALIKPAIPSVGTIARHTIVVLDSSGSMGAMEGGLSRFQRSKQEIKTLIDQLASGQTITLIEAGRVPRVLLSNSSNQAALQAQLQAVPLRYGTADQRGALSLARAIASSVPGSGVMWFGDGGPGKLPEKELAGFTRDTFRFIQAGSSKENVTIGAFVTQQSEKGWQGLVRIDNHGVQNRQGNLMIYDASRKLLEAKAFQVSTQESETLTFSALPASPAYEAVLDIPDDGMRADNSQWSIPLNGGKARVILVSPEGNRFLHEVLKLSRVQVETMADVPQNVDLAPDLWIFDGVVPDVLPPGNIMLIGPNRATSWLPYQGNRELAAPVANPEESHPIMRYADFKNLHLNTMARIAPMKEMKALLRNGDDPVILAGNLQGRRSVILSFDLHQSDLPLRPAYPIFMQNVLSWLTPVQSAPIDPGYPGEAISIPLTPGGTERAIILPDGKKLEINERSSMLLYQVPEQVGLYRLEERIDGKVTERLFQVSMREEERKIAPTLMQAQTGQEETTEENSPEAGVRSIYSYQDFTGWLIVIALLILFAEWRVYQRGH